MLGIELEMADARSMQCPIPLASLRQGSSPRLKNCSSVCVKSPALAPALAKKLKNIRMVILGQTIGPSSPVFVSNSSQYHSFRGSVQRS